MRNKIIQGDVLDDGTWKEIPDQSVHCVVTSPPYWALRDYGVDGQLGLEETPDKYIENMVAVFRHVWRVLRDDGTLWLNMGDNYNSQGGHKNIEDDGRANREMRAKMKGVTVKNLKPKDLCGMPWRLALALQADGWYLRQDIIWHKPSPMPESCRDRCTKAHEYIFLLTKKPRYYFDAVAIAEPCSEKTNDRGHGVNPKASGTGIGWGYTGDATQGDAKPRWKTPDGWDTSTGQGDHGSIHKQGREKGHKPKIKQNKSFSDSVNERVTTRNKRSVWTIASQSYSEAHFATFPEALVTPCILAGTSKKGCCPECGSPWVRVTDKAPIKRPRPNDFVKRTGEPGTGNSCSNTVAGVSVNTAGWRPTCKCDLIKWYHFVDTAICEMPRTSNARKYNQQEATRRWHERAKARSDKYIVPLHHAEFTTQPPIVLDLFLGSGTTAAVARMLDRDYLGIDLSAEYIKLAVDRIGAAENPTTYVKQQTPDNAPLFAENLTSNP